MRHGSGGHVVIETIITSKTDLRLDSLVSIM